jgi:hypothetical protein
MEVVVSAAVLIIVVLGVMAALDAVTGTAGANKARTVAATLAERDQEELRSLKTADLNQLETLIPAPRTVTVDGVPYTITSAAKVITDADGEDISCALEDGEGAYVRITSTVTSPMTGAKVKPVTLSSIVAPEPGSGTLVARVRNAKDDPVVNMPVSASVEGTTVKTVTTNDAGCAVFGTMDSGSYEIRVNQLNWVDPDGNQEVVKTATVAAGTVTTVEFLYDIGATVDVTIRSLPGTGTVAQTDRSYGMIAAHNGISATHRYWPEPDVALPPEQSTFTLSRLFPFDEDPYTLYSGRCTDADPIRQPNYYSVVEGWGASHDATPALTPGERRAITIYELAVNLNATWSGIAITSTSANRAYAYAYPKDGACPEPYRLPLGEVTLGAAQLPGVPSGTYDICVERYRDSSRGWYRHMLYDVAVDRLPGTATQNAPLTTSSTRSRCA